MRPDRPDRAVAAGGPAGERPGPRRSHAAISGAWTNGWTSGACPCPSTHPLSFARADLELCFQPHPAASCACRTRTCTFPPATWRRTRPAYDADPLRGHAGRAGRGEALGLQRSAARARAVTRTRRRRREEYRKLTTRVTDLHPMTIIQNAPDLRRRPGVAGADPGGHRGAGGDLEGGEGFHLARRQARQPLRHAAHDADDRQAAARLRRCPCRLLADHPNVQFNFYRPGDRGRSPRKCTDGRASTASRVSRSAAAGLNPDGGTCG